jgi:hypothetical protein
LRILNLLVPDGVVHENFVDSITHVGKNIRDAFEEWSGEDVHEPNLRFAQLDDIVADWWTAEQAGWDL